MSQSFCKEYLQRNSLQIADWPAIEKESVKLVKYIASELDSTNPRWKLTWLLWISVLELALAQTRGNQYRWLTSGGRRPFRLRYFILSILTNFQVVESAVFDVIRFGEHLFTATTFTACLLRLTFGRTSLEKSIFPFLSTNVEKQKILLFREQNHQELFSFHFFIKRPCFQRAICMYHTFI